MAITKKQPPTTGQFLFDGALTIVTRAMEHARKAALYDELGELGLMPSQDKIEAARRRKPIILDAVIIDDGNGKGGR